MGRLRTLARKLNEAAMPDAPEEDGVGSFVRLKALARHWDCDPRTIKRMIMRGELRGYRRGGTIVVKRADADAYVAAREIKPRPKLDSSSILPAPRAHPIPEARP